MIEAQMFSLQGPFLSVDCGGMCAGKSNQLGTRLRVAKYAGGGVVCYAHPDTIRPELGEDENTAASRSGLTTNVTRIKDLSSVDVDVLLRAGVKSIGIDEAPFYKDLVYHVRRFLAAGFRVFVAGLDQLHTTEPFGPMGELMMMAEFVHKHHACCFYCGRQTVHSLKVGGDKTKDVEVGDSEYVPVCRDCYHGRPRGSLGQLHLIAAGVGAGKKEALLAALSPHHKAGVPVRCIEYREDTHIPNWGDRHREVELVRPGGLPVTLDAAEQRHVVAIRHAHHAPIELFSYVRRLLDQGAYVVVSGLNVDDQIKPYLSMARLAVEADQVYSLHARCGTCHQPAFWSKRVEPTTYSASCRRCHNGN